MESVIFHLNTVRQATLAMGGEMGERRPHGGRDGAFGAHYNKNVLIFFFFKSY